MKKHILLNLFIYLIINSVTSQVTLKGSITDVKTNEKLIGVSVLIKGSTKGVQSDYDGQFALKTNNALPLTLTVKYLGYETKDILIENADNKIIVKLVKSEKTLKELTIKDSRITEKIKQNPLTVETMDAIAIKSTPAANFYEGLAHLKGVDITSASIGFKIINTRGFNSTSPVRSLQLIDGVDNQSPGLNFSLGNFLGASELDVQKVDLVVGASSAYYGPNAFNGVINMQTKNPFLFPGFSAQVKVGERNLTETAIRWAKVVKNKKGEDKFAYKVNLFYMRANDWNANNMNPTSQSPVGSNNPGNYDAVNRYGDEFANNNVFYTPLSIPSSVGKGYYLRNGYSESDLVDYNSRNLKLGGAAHYKVTKNTELIYTTNFGTGTTVYQGENRFSLRDILFFQNKLEYKKENRFFIRAYATNEDAGNSYDAYNTALLMQNAAKSDEFWGKDYNNALTSRLSPLVSAWIDANTGAGIRLDTVPRANNQRLNFIDNYWRTYLADSLIKYHNISRQIANSAGGLSTSSTARFEPGTARFDSAFNAITSRTNQNGGSRFFDQSALYHVAGEYKFNIPDYKVGIFEANKKNIATKLYSYPIKYASYLLNKFASFTSGLDVTVGGNYRIYVPYSQGTIFKDGEDIRTVYAKDANGIILKQQSDGKDSIIGKESAGFTQITNQEFGAYIGLERKFMENKLKVSVTNRIDKNQNFNFLWSPAATFVYTQKKNVFRFSLSSAVRNPTLTDQYFNLKVGRATLLGNLNGYQDLLAIDTLRDILVNNKRYAADGSDRLKTSSFDIDAIRPERCKTIEVGYRGNITEKLFVDASYYFSWYEDFLGYKIGAQVVWYSLNPFPTSINAFRVTTNSKDVVTTQGFTIGLNYFYKNYLGFSGNYSWNKLDRGGSKDPIIPAFNTPEHKFNLGVNGRDILYKGKKERWGYGINYKWQQGFLFEGSPQFTGFVQSYGMLDIQLNTTITKIKSVFKIGASNVLNNLVYQVYGGPSVGRLAYASITFELNKWK